jgi:hypothetical protein
VQRNTGRGSDRNHITAASHSAYQAICLTATIEKHEAQSMDMTLLFQLSIFLTLPFWLLMILLPMWRWTQRIIGSPWIAVPAALLYAILTLPRLGALLPLLANPSLASIATLLGTPAGATLARVHMLAFDVFIGRWIYLDSRENRITPWLMAPVLA